MSDSLVAVVHGDSRTGRYITKWYAMGLMIGAGVSWFILQAVMDLISVTSAARFVPKLAIAGVIALLVSQLVGNRAFQTPWQVPYIWFQVFPGRVVAVLFGAILGMGVWTSTVTNAFWLIPVASLTASPMLSGSLWIAFAAGRLLVFVRSTRGGDTREFEPTAYLLRDRAIRWTNVFGLAGVVILMSRGSW